MNFDKKIFSEILIKIKDSYGSINQMAEKTGVTAAYLSKLIRLMYDNAPSPEILKKIADNSNGIVTYDDLMSICGYLNYDFDNMLLNVFGIKNSNFNSIIENLNFTNYEKKLLFDFLLEPRKNSHKIDECYSKEDYKKFQTAIMYFLKNANYLQLLNSYNDMELLDISFLEDVISFSKDENLNKYLHQILTKVNSYNSVKDLPYNLTEIPIVGKIAAGQPILAEEYIEGYLPVDPNIYGVSTAEDLFYLRIAR